MCLFYSSLCVPLAVSVLQQYRRLCCLRTSTSTGSLPLDRSVLKQPVLPRDLSVIRNLSCLCTCVLQQPMLPLTCLFSGSLCCTWTCLVNSSLLCYWTCLFYSSLCCSWTCMLAILQQSVHPEMSGLSLYISIFCTWTCLSTMILCALVVSVYKSLCCTYARLQELLFCTWTSLSSRACAALVFVCLQENCAAPGRVCLQEPVLHMCLSTRAYVLYLHGRVYLQARACAALVRLCLQELCAAPWHVCLQEPVFHLSVSVYKSFVLNLDMSAYKNPAEATPVGVRTVYKFFWFDSVCTKQVCLFRLFRYVFETPNKPKNLFFVSWNRLEKTETDFVSVQTENIFICFEDTLHVVSENAWLRRNVQSQADFNRSTLQSRKKDTAHRKIIYQIMEALTEEHITAEQSIFCNRWKRSKKQNGVEQRAEQSRVEQRRIQQSRVEQGRVEQSRAE